LQRVEYLRLVNFVLSLRFPVLFCRDTYYFPPRGLIGEAAWLQTVLRKSDDSVVARSNQAILLYLQLLEVQARRLKSEIREELYALLNEMAELVRQQKGLQRIPPYRSKKSLKRFTIEDAQQVLSDLLRDFSVLDKPWHIISGTFLGCVRERGFLGHDYDIDIGIDPSEVFSFLAATESSAAFRVKKIRELPSPVAKRYGIENPRSLYVLEHCSGIEVDVFLHYVFNDQVLHLTQIHTWTNSAYGLKPYDFYGHKVYGPANAERYLSENYGCNWRTPIVDFNSSTDTPNGMATPCLQGLLFFLKKMAQAAVSQDQELFNDYANLLIRSDLFSETCDQRWTISRFLL
jgi:hypothetical protein